ncbi:MAG: hypothetical protein CVT48_05315 [Thermoplasmata archaeon HGW-Thermoplasmata-1]|nr:MAG: hypothetical protein CVT48_05315 [Thermoplasmata archaeon HGW-Thermoplasmata-1]
MHDVNSVMLWIHPPLAVAAHLLVLFCLYPSFSRDRRVRWLPLAAWLAVLAGLVSGMIWAQLAWESYWSWDPKEIVTLVLFLGVSAHAFFYYRLPKENEFGQPRAVRILAVVNCVLVAATLLSGLILKGLHSYI